MTARDDLSTPSSSAAGVQAGLLVAMAVWGLNVSAVKTLTLHFAPLPLASVRMVTACLALTAIVLLRRCAVPALDGRQRLSLVGCGVLMVYVNQMLFAEGLLRSTATNAAMIMALSPLISALLATLAFRERVTLRQLAGMALGFGGVAAVVLSHPGARLSTAGVGDLMLVGGVVSFAAGGVLVQRLARHLNPLPVSWAIYLVGTFLLIVHMLWAGTPASAPMGRIGLWAWTLVVFSGVFATAVCNLLWNGAIARIGVARTAVFLYWVPVFGVLFAALLLDEKLTGWHALGFSAVIGGTWLGTRRPI